MQVLLRICTTLVRVDIVGTLAMSAALLIYLNWR